VSTPGRVALVGAGPGDPELITLRGLTRLRAADVVVYDRLVDRRLVDEAPPHALRIYAGKTCGEHTLPQDEINALLVRHATAGSHVVRLKGGDPFVFGRGSEEAQALARAGIPYEVVPGVSAALAVPAAAGIPVTHRGVAASFAVVTGHACTDDANIDWRRLATAVDTIIVLMGLGNLPRIATELLAHGRPPTTPVAVISKGTTAAQTTVIGTLLNIAQQVADANITAPAVIVIGDVVSVRDRLSDVAALNEEALAF
jgi:uroporphyrin-III C-methyltransferase